MKKVLVVDLTSGKFGRTDVLDAADTSLTAYPGKTPIGGLSGALDSSWLGGSGGSGGLANPMTTLGDLIVGAGAGGYPPTPGAIFEAQDVLVELTEAEGGTEVIIPGCELFVTPLAGGSVKITYTVWASQNHYGYVKPVTLRLRRDNLIGSALVTTAGGVSADSSNGHNVSWSNTYIDAAPTTGLYVLTIHFSGPAGGTCWTNWRQMALYASEAAGVPSRLPAGPEGYALISVGGTPVWTPINAAILKGHAIPDDGTPGQALRIADDLTMEWYTPGTDGGGASSGEGLTNPMTTAGDLIVGLAASTVNIATVNDGATAIASNGGTSHPDYVMANDPGYWSSTSTGNSEWVGMSWPTAQTIVAARLVQPGDWISGYMISQYRFQSSLDLVSWYDHSTNLTAQDSGLVMLTDTRAAMYWRVVGIGSTLGYQWRVATLELHIGRPNGSPGRLGLGTQSQVPMVLSGALAYQHLLPPFDVRPTTAHAKDDEFNGTTFDAKWSNLSSGTDLQWTKTVAGGWLVVEPATSGSANTGKHLMGIRQNAPTGAFSVSAKLAGTYRPDDVREGIFVSDGTRMNVLGYDLANNNFVAAIGCNNYSETADAGSYDGFAVGFGGVKLAVPLWVKIVWASGTLSFYYSLNGVIWTLLTTRTSMNQPTRIGLCQYAQVSSNSIFADHQLACDWFRVTEP